MFSRLTIFIAILLMVAGVFFSVVTAFPAVGKILAAPFCKEVVETNFGNTLTCLNGDGEQNLTTIFVAGGAGLIFGGAMLLTFSLVGSLMFMSAKLNRIIRTGEPAEATILDIQGTGVTVNNQPMLKFRLRVENGYDAPYEAETNRIIPFGMRGYLMIGATIPVKYDPKKPQDVAIDFDSMKHDMLSFGAATFSSSSPEPEESLSDKLRELEDSYQAGLINQEEYEDARKRIINKF
jgi:hypothetical protein